MTDGRADSLKKKSFEMTGDKSDQDSWVKMAQNSAHPAFLGAPATRSYQCTQPVVTRRTILCIACNRPQGRTCVAPVLRCEAAAAVARTSAAATAFATGSPARTFCHTRRTKTSRNPSSQSLCHVRPVVRHQPHRHCCRAFKHPRSADGRGAVHRCHTQTATRWSATTLSWT